MSTLRMRPTGSPQPNEAREAARPARERVLFWLVVVLTGAGAGLSGAALMKLLRIVQHLAWSYQAGHFIDAAQRASAWRRLVVVALAGAVVAAAKPVLKLVPGGHPGSLAKAIWSRAGALPFVNTILRAVLSIVIVGMGASLGREMAFKQAGAALGAKLSDLARMPAHDRRLLAAAGTAGGFAAAYNVPIGAGLFALEVLLGTLALDTAIPVLLVSVLATVVSRLFLPRGPLYHVPHYPAAAPDVAWCLVGAPLLGLAGAGVVRVIAWCDARKPWGGWPATSPVLVFLGLGAVSVAWPELLGNGRGVVDRAFLGELSLGLLAVLPVLKLAATGACLGASAPGGVFTPTLAIGAPLGGLLGCALARLWPGAEPASFAVLGAAALLAGTVHAPFSSVVLVLELTDDWRLLVPLSLSATLSCAVSRYLVPDSVYAARVRGGAHGRPR